MLNVKSLSRFTIAGACVFAVLVMTGSSATARPQYATAMSKAYPDLTKKHGKNGKLACATCHPTRNKKERNNYGAALGKALGKPKVSDKEKLKEALTKIEKEKSATEGKTFGDLIKAGELPGTKDVAK